MFACVVSSFLLPVPVLLAFPFFYDDDDDNDNFLIVKKKIVVFILVFSKKNRLSFFFTDLNDVVHETVLLPCVSRFHVTLLLLYFKTCILIIIYIIVNINKFTIADAR